MREKEMELQGGSLYYVIKEDGAHITRSSRLKGEIIVPQSVPEGDESEAASQVPIVAVGKKAFLSQKKLRRITLPHLSILSENGRLPIAAIWRV